MGSGSWSADSFKTYTTSYKKMSLDDSGTRIRGTYSNQDNFKQKSIDSALDPREFDYRECCDSEEHPNTKPVILALDVTGSMGEAAMEVAKELNVIMTDLYNDANCKDIQFCTMGIGDFYCDRSPLQVSQFESDIRIAEQLDKIYFEFGGGGNDYESYTGSWIFGLTRCKLDCYDKRGKKGLIITIGDEKINPYIDIDEWSAKAMNFNAEMQDKKLYTDVKYLYEKASEKFEIYHIHVKHGRFHSRSSMDGYATSCVESFREVLPSQHVMYIEDTSELADKIKDIVIEYCKNLATDSASVLASGSNPVEEPIIGSDSNIQRDENGMITW